MSLFLVPSTSSPHLLPLTTTKPSINLSLLPTPLLLFPFSFHIRLWIDSLLAPDSHTPVNARFVARLKPKVPFTFSVLRQILTLTTPGISSPPLPFVFVCWFKERREGREERREERANWYSESMDYQEFPDPESQPTLLSYLLKNV